MNNTSNTAAAIAIEKARVVLHMYALPLAIEAYNAEAENAIRDALASIYATVEELDNKTTGD